MKHLLVCCDGIWNTPAMDGGPTNVFRLYEALAARNQGRQQKHYVEGIGADGGPMSRIVMGAVGSGLKHKMVEAYHWLARHYEPEEVDGHPDKISLFGFSRGAYTARNLAGLLTSYGLIRLPPGTGEGDQALAREVYSAYHQNQTSASMWRQFSTRRIPFERKVEVYFLGVWDTVGSLGIPADFGVLGLFDPSKYRFYNTRLSDRVIHARHAVALDEYRGPFAPTLWKTRDDVGGLTFRQVWFPGNHGNIGGSATDRGLSDGALEWMISQAQDCGLTFNPVPQLAPHPGGELIDNLRSFYRVVNPHPRAVPRVVDSEVVHESATQRIKIVRGYRPQAELHYVDGINTAKVTVRADQPWNETGLWLAPGTYRLSAFGKWYDRGAPYGPSGKPAGFQTSFLARGTAKVAEWLQGGIRKLTGNDEARVLGTRRVILDGDGNEVPWMCLVGVVADGVLAPNTELQRPHTTFRIGGGIEEFEVFRAGYLYAFANDAGGSYFNNSGSIALTVQELNRDRPPV